MRKWSESQAVSVVNSNGGETRGKSIVSKGGLKGLTACSAYDFLVNHCGYRGNL